MILDSQLQFSDAQALTATAVSTNVLDMGAPLRKLGVDTGLVVLITVDVAADFTTEDETYSFALQMDTTAAFGSATEVASRTILAADLTAGSQHVIPIPSHIWVEQFLRLNTTLAGTTPTITFTAFLQPHNHVQNEAVYPDNSTITT